MRHDLEALKEWIGRRETLVDHVTIPATNRLAALLDRDDPMPRVGDPLPHGWHSIMFPRVVRQSEIGVDGHPERGDFLPPVPLPRRMFAGRRTWFHAPLAIGDEATKDAVIHDVQIKEGRSGQMVFVTVRAEITTTRGLAIVEEQDIVYRGEPPKDAARETLKPPATPPAMPPASTPWTQTIVADTVRLFRYSALTYNGHRIHYDYPYVTGTEGYPALVMNGGLTGVLLYELIRTNAKRPLTMLATRNLAPLFANQTIRLGGTPSADELSADVFAATPAGAYAVSARAEFG